METNLQKLCETLDAFAEAVEQAGDDEYIGNEHWTVPRFNKYDISHIVSELSRSIKAAEISLLTDDEMDTVQSAQVIIGDLDENVIPNLFTDEVQEAYSTVLNAILLVRLMIEPILKWVPPIARSWLPKSLANRLESLNIQVDNLNSSSETLAAKIKLIEGASEAADALPITMKNLSDAQKQIDGIRDSVSLSKGSADRAKESVEKLVESLKEKHKEADDLLKKSSEAYRISTSNALALSFEQRRRNLHLTQWIWVFILVSSLVFGYFFGIDKAKEVLAVGASSGVTIGEAIIRVAVAVLSLAAPVWLAWLATKQIGQRFKLTEDYAFKASVARAYEGYRREAQRIDPAFESRLFASALDRIDEAPLRLVEEGSYGSPWHELFDSKGFSDALEKMPNLREILSEKLRPYLSASRTRTARPPEEEDSFDEMEEEGASR